MARTRGEALYVGGPGHPVQHLPVGLFDLLLAALRNLATALVDFYVVALRLILSICNLVMMMIVGAIVIPCLACLYALQIIAFIVKYAPHIIICLGMYGAVRIINAVGWELLDSVRAWFNYWICQFMYPSHVHLCLDDWRQHPTLFWRGFP